MIQIPGSAEELNASLDCAKQNPFYQRWMPQLLPPFRVRNKAKLL